MCVYLLKRFLEYQSKPSSAPPAPCPGSLLSLESHQGAQGVWGPSLIKQCSEELMAKLCCSQPLPWFRDCASVI